MKNKFFNVFSNIIIVVSLIFIFTNLFLIVNGNTQRKFVPSVFGYKFLIEMSDSMRPELNVGDLIIIKEKDNYKEGDIISFKNNNDVLITHRIISVIDKEGTTYFQTKGDYNQTEDIDLVEFDSVAGSVVNSVNEVGNVILFLATPVGMVVLVLVVITFFLICYTINKLKEDSDKAKEVEVI